MTFRPGDDVIVEFDGWEHRGEVTSIQYGWVFAKIVVDPLVDYGSVTPRLSPQSVVCVRENHVRHADPTSA